MLGLDTCFGRSEQPHGLDHEMEPEGAKLPRGCWGGIRSQCGRVALPEGVGVTARARRRWPLSPYQHGQLNYEI